MTLWIQEEFVNETKNQRFSNGPWIDTDCSEIGELFRRLSREYGRCISKIYVDKMSGPPMQVGWVFEKRMEYDDAHRIRDKADRTYIRHVWVNVSNGDPHQPLHPVSPWEKEQNHAQP